MSTPAQPDGPRSRFYDLDALRAFAMSLGIVLHTCLFLTVGTGWPVLDAAVEEADPVYGTINAVIHGFRMPLFFMVSGFFSALLWQRRGLRALAVQRLKRVGIPLALGCVTIVPAIALVVIAAGLIEEDIPLFVLPFIWLIDMAHLWFLWYLLLMAVAFMVLVKMGVQFRRPVIWWLAVPVTCGFMLLMDQRIFGADSLFGVYIPAIENELSLLPNPIVLGYYVPYFLFGAFLYQRGFAVQSWWAAAIIPAAPAYYFGSHFLGAGYGASGLLLSAPFQTAFAWLLCFGMLGLFRWIAARESNWTLYFSDASYWMYLVHVPLVMVGHILVIDLPIHYHAKFLLVLLGVILAILGSYQLFVRYSFIGRILNGPRARPAPSAARPSGR